MTPSSSSSDSSSFSGIQSPSLDIRNDEVLVPLEESITDQVAQGIFANEYKSMSDICESEIALWETENAHPEKTWRYFFRQHQNKMKWGAVAVGVSGLATAILPWIVCAAAHLKCNGVSLILSTFSGLFLTAGGAGFALHKLGEQHFEKLTGMKDWEENSFDEIEDKTNQLRDDVKVAHAVEQLFLAWKDFENDPQVNKISHLIDMLEKVDYVDNYKKVRLIEKYDNLFLLDEICQKLKEDEAATQWEKLKASTLKDILIYGLKGFPWKRLKIKEPTNSFYCTFRKELRLKENKQPIIDRIVEKTREKFTSNKFFLPSARSVNW